MTIREIAEELKLSKSTVALALAGKYGPNEQTAAKVMLFAHEHGYDFSKLRKNREKESSRIAVLTFKNALGQQFWSNVFMGIEQGLMENCCKAEIVVYDEPDFKEIIERLKKSLYIGVVSVDYDNPSPKQDPLGEFQIPVVVIDPRKFVGGSYNQIFPSNYHSGVQCAEYLIHRGHRSLAFWGDISYGFGLKQRYQGFMEGISNYKGEVQVLSLTEKGDEMCEHVANGQRFMEVFTNDEHPTALMCANDIIAYHAYDLLKRLKRRIPKDVSIIAFDNREKSGYIFPKLSTFNVDGVQMGKRAIEIIMHQKNNPAACKEIVQLYSNLVERESVCDGPKSRHC